MTIAEEIRRDPQLGAKRLESEYRAGLTTLARRLCHDPGDAAELVNRTFAEAIANIDTYAEQSAFFAWISKILVNLNAKEKRRESNQTVTYPGIVPDVIDEDAQEAIYANLDASLLRDAISELPAEMRDVVVMRYFIDLPLSRIAKILSVPEGTVNSRLHNAKLALAAKLGVAADKAKDAVKKPGVKATLLALVLCATAALGAVWWGEFSERAADAWSRSVATAIGETDGTGETSETGGTSGSGGVSPVASTPTPVPPDSPVPPVPEVPFVPDVPSTTLPKGTTMNNTTLRTSSAILAAATLMTGAAIPSMTSGDQAQVTTNGTEVTVYVPDGTTYELTTPLDANVTKLIKTGGGRCNLKATNTSDGRTGLISAGILAIDDRSSGVAAGWTRIDVEDGATLDLFLGSSGISRVGWSCLRSVPIYIAGSGCGGMGAIANTGTITVDATCAYVTLTADAQIGGSSDRANYTLGTGSGTPTQTLLDMQGHTLTLAGRVGFFTAIVIKNLGSLAVAENKALSMEPSNSIKLANTQTLAAANPTVTFGSGSSLTFNPRAAGVDAFPWGISVPAASGAVTLTSTSPKTLRITRPVVADGTLYLAGTQADVLVEGSMEGNVVGTGTANAKTVAVANQAAVTVGAIEATHGTLLFEDVARLSVTNQGTIQPNGLAGSGEVTIGGAAGDAANVARLVLKGDTHFTQDTGANGTNFVMIGCATYQYGLLDLKDGATLTNCIYVGKGGVGAINVYDDDGLGTSLHAPARDRQLLGDGLNSYGCLNVFGGKVFLPGQYRSLLGRDFGTGVVAQHGGEMTTDGYLWLSRGGSCSHWFMDGGTFTSSDINGEGVRMCASDGNFSWKDGYAVLTVGGDPLKTARMQIGAIQCFTANYSSGTDNTLMAINLNTNGWLATPRISRTTQDISEAWNRPVGFDINFNGGTLHASRNDNLEFFGEGKRRPRQVTVYAGGATIETEGDVTWLAAIRAPTGKGLAVTLDDADAIAATDWIGPTRVYASGGSGTGFTGLTDVDPATGRLRGVIVTSPGWGYQDGDEVSVSAAKPNPSASYACTATLVDLPATGGLTKKGPGQLTLDYENTYGGATRVEEGTIRFTHVSGMPEGGVVEVPAGVLAGIEDPLVNAKVFRASKIVVTDVTTPLPQGLQTVIVSDTELTVPPVEFRNAAGQAIAAPNGFVCEAGSDRKSIRLGVPNAFTIIIR